MTWIQTYAVSLRFLRAALGMSGKFPKLQASGQRGQRGRSAEAGSLPLASREEGQAITRVAQMLESEDQQSQLGFAGQKEAQVGGVTEHAFPSFDTLDSGLSPRAAQRLRWLQSLGAIRCRIQTVADLACRSARSARERRARPPR